MNTKFKQTEIGEIPEDWSLMSVSEFSEVVGGSTPSTKDELNFNGDIAWITPRDLSNWIYKRISKGERSITKKGFKDSGVKLLPKNTVLLTSRAPVGYVAIANNPVTTNQGFKSLVPKDNVDSEFLYYLLKSNTERLKNNASGSTFEELSGNVLKQMKFGLPNVYEQQQIASILSSLDDKIELNRRLNKSLEEIAKALFKHWFVDFEFPNEKGESYKSSGGKMINSELGMVPNGWSVKKLDEISEFQNGYAFYTIGYSDKGMKVVDLLNIGEDGFFKESERDKFVSEEIYTNQRFSKYLLKENDLVMAMTDMTQNMAILGKSCKIYKSGKFILNQRIGRIRAKERINVNFLWSYLNSTEILDNLKEKSLGTVQKYVNTNHIKDLQFRIPPQSMMDNFSNLSNQLFDKIRINYDEISLLTKIRNSLQPKLMNGSIRTI